MTKLEAINDLYQHDHAFLTAEYANKIAGIFGIKAPIYEAVDTRSQHKGLTLRGMKEGDTAKGCDAHRLAEAIADSMKLQYPDMFGIGSRLRVACEAVRQHLTK